MTKEIEEYVEGSVEERMAYRDKDETLKNKVGGEQIMKMAIDMYGTMKITQEQLAYIIDTMDPVNYMLRNHSIKGSPITFEVSDKENARAHRPWQKNILRDTHPNIAVKKSRQLGISEISVGKALHFLDTHSYDKVKALYTFPTKSNMNDHVSTRINPLLEKGYYGEIADKRMDSNNVKRIRDSIIYFRTSSKSSALEGIDIDLMMLDEYDHVNPSAEQSAIESMSSSKYKIANRWSTPTIGDMGISRLYDRSDQYNYLHKCGGCNYWNLMSYKDYDPNNLENSGNKLLLNPEGVDRLAKTVVEGSYQYVCQKCGKPLDRFNGEAEWVPKYPSRTQGGRGIRGYFISQLNAAWLSLDNIVTKELESVSKSSFYNYVLGESYDDEQLTVNDSDILGHLYDNETFNRDDYRFISTGIDWGNSHSIIVEGVTSDGRIDLLDAATVDKPGPTDIGGAGSDMLKIRQYLDKYDPDIIVADIGDSGDKIIQLMRMYGKEKVWGCRYKSSPRSSGNIIPSWSESNNTVTVDKLMQNKRFIGMMKNDRVFFPRNNKRLLDEYIYQWKNVKIRTEEDERTGEFYEVITRSGDDHFAQASIYANLGIDRLVDVYYGDGSYEFDSTFVELNQPPEPTLPDIFTNY